MVERGHEDLFLKNKMRMQGISLRPPFVSGNEAFRIFIYARKALHVCDSDASRDKSRSPRQACIHPALSALYLHFVTRPAHK
jgi:hypothetical protein